MILLDLLRPSQLKLRDSSGEAVIFFTDIKIIIYVGMLNRP